MALITVAAAVLRLLYIGRVSPDPFYDAAVRSMTLSWHNFFFGAFDPGATLSVDKPPLDLWLQVISVKVLGWNQFALKLPEALAGTLAVPLLYDVVRRCVGVSAAIAELVTMTSASFTFSARWPSNTVAPSPESRCVTAEIFRSEPETL